MILAVSDEGNFIRNAEHTRFVYNFNFHNFLFPLAWRDCACAPCTDGLYLPSVFSSVLQMQELTVGESFNLLA